MPLLQDIAAASRIRATSGCRPPRVRSSGTLAYCREAIGAMWLTAIKGAPVPPQAHHNASTSFVRLQPALPMSQQPPDLLAGHHDFPKGCIHCCLARVSRGHPAWCQPVIISAVVPLQQVQAPGRHQAGRSNGQSCLLTCRLPPDDPQCTSRWS